MCEVMFGLALCALVFGLALCDLVFVLALCDLVFGLTLCALVFGLALIHDTEAGVVDHKQSTYRGKTVRRNDSLKVNPNVKRITENTKHYVTSKRFFKIKLLPNLPYTQVCVLVFCLTLRDFDVWYCNVLIFWSKTDAYSMSCVVYG
jgi:hypothetical protein